MIATALRYGLTSLALAAGLPLLLPRVGRADDKAKGRTDAGRAELEAKANARYDEAKNLYAQGKVIEATNATRDALAMYRTLFPNDKYPQGHPNLSGTLNDLGFLLQQQGKFEQTEPLFREALAMRRAQFPAGTHPQGHDDIADTLNNLGGALMQQGKYEEAEPVWRGSLAMLRALYPADKHPHGHPDLAMSMNNLGLLLQLQGRLGEAEPFYRDGLAMSRALHPPNKYPNGTPNLAVNIGNVGFLLEAQGKLGEAEPFYRESLTMLRALFPPDKYPHGHPNIAISLNNLGSLNQALGKVREAEQYYRDSLAMRRALFPADKFPQGHQSIAEVINNLAGLLLTADRVGEAEPLYRDALAMSRTLFPADTHPQGHLDLARSLNNLGELLQEQGKFAEAEPLYRDTLAMLRTLLPADKYPHGHPNLAATLNNLGLLFLAKGRLGEAEPFFRDALAMYSRLAGKLGESAAEHVALDYVGRQPLCRDLLLSATTQSSTPLAQQYKSIWQSRSGISNIYERRHAALRSSLDAPQVRQIWSRLATQRRGRERLLLAVAPKDAAARERRDRELVAATERVDALERELINALPDLARSLKQAQTMPAELRKALPAGTAFIDLLQYTLFQCDPTKPGKAGEKRTTSFVAFVVTRDAVERIELGPAAPIDAAVTLWRQGIVEGSTGAARDVAALRRLVWQPIEAKLPPGTTAVYLAPDASLTQLPFAALPGRDADKQPGRVLLDDYAVATVPHGPFLLDWLTRSAAPPAEPALLAVGGVRYDDQPNATTAVVHRGAPEGVTAALRWQYLDGAVAEARQVRTLAEKAGLRVAHLDSDRANAAAVLTELPKATVAHLATHGYFADKSFRSVLQLDEKLYERGGRMGTGERIGSGAKSPMVLSGLVLAGANRPDTPSRGILTGEALLGTDLRKLELAVLSACETGLGDVAGGEGVYGLTRAFHVCGTKNVIASLWKVDDDATAALMTLFYRNLWEEKLPPIEALRQAQLAVYRNPAGIAAWSKGERGPNFKAPVPGSATAPTPPSLAGGDKRASVKQWAAFVLSGVGR